MRTQRRFRGISTFEDDRKREREGGRREGVKEEVKYSEPLNKGNSLGHLSSLRGVPYSEVLLVYEVEPQCSLLRGVLIWRGLFQRL